jgi:hypothetical protein
MAASLLSKHQPSLRFGPGLLVLLTSAAGLSSAGCGPGTSSSNVPLLCYELKNVQFFEPPKVRNFRTQFSEEKNVKITALVYVCEPAFKSHKEADLPKDPPPWKPLTCYRIGGEPLSGVKRILKDDNQLFDGEVEVTDPYLFCDPVSSKKVKGKERPGKKYPSPLKAYSIKVNKIFAMKTVFVRDQFGAQQIKLKSTSHLLEPASKAKDASPPEPPKSLSPRTCFTLTTDVKDLNQVVTVTDQFGVWNANLGKPDFFCEPTKKTAPP